MSDLGVLPEADVAIFADTGQEPVGVYKHLEWLEDHVDIPIIRVSAGDLGKDTVDHIEGRRARVASIPFFTQDGESAGMTRRQCTQDYKIAPIRRKIREIMPKGTQVELWIGISTDEIQRMKDSNVKYIKHRWPLIERRMSRQDCLAWYDSMDYPKPAKSACVFCPYRKDAEWQRMKDEEPEAFAAAVEFDRKVRNMPKLDSKCFLHRSLQPLSEVDFNQTHGQFDFGFGNECEGMCGI
jgi:hypothetical protein